MNTDAQWQEYRSAARAGELARAIGELLAEVVGAEVPYGPGGHAVLPDTVLTRCARTDAVVELARVHVGTDQWVAIRRPRSDPADQGVDNRHAAWLLGLLWLRLGQSQWLLDRCLDHLSGRSAGGTPLVNQQLVRGSLADAATDQLTVHTLLDGAAPGTLGATQTDDLHRQVTAADRTLLRLLGGSGFLSNSPGQAAYLSEILAEVYAGRRPEDT